MRSILDPTLIEMATQVDAELRQHVDEEDDEDAWKNQADGSIIAWQTGDQLSMAGILHVVLALILINGRVLPDGKNKLSPVSLAHNELTSFKSSSVEILLEGSTSPAIYRTPGHATIDAQNGHA